MMDSKLKTAGRDEDVIHRSSSPRLDARQGGIDTAAGSAGGHAGIHRAAKTYTRPELTQLGCLSTLIMGMSGFGIDSVSRREF